MTNALTPVWVEHYLHPIQEGCGNLISYEHMRTEARLLATLANLQNFDSPVYRLVIVYFATKFCMGHVLQMVCDYSKYECSAENWESHL